MTLFHKLNIAAGRLLFPERCPVCGDVLYPAGGETCAECREILVPIHGPVCMKCGKQLEHDQTELCTNCSRYSFSFDRGFSLYPYNEVLQESLSALKYENRQSFARFYANRLYERFGDTMTSLGIRLLIPVPVHPDRLRQRGYNQAGLIARHLSERSGIPLSEDFLIRTRKTAAQKELSPAERRKNLADAFGTDPASRPDPDRLSAVALIDDIYTTGSTADACARVLKKAGVRHVFVFTVASGGL